VKENPVSETEFFTAPHSPTGFLADSWQIPGGLLAFLVDITSWEGQLLEAVLGVLGTVVVVVVVVVAVLFSSLAVLLSWFSIPVLVASMGLILILIIHVTS
jgi:hypothetical protein